MGRKRKYFTDEEKKQANRSKVLKYYWNNKEACDQRAKDRYWAKKLAHANNGSGSLEPVKEEVQEEAHQLQDTPTVNDQQQ